MQVQLLRKLFPIYWLITAAAFAGTVTLVAKWTPIEETMGPIQKIFYLHLPCAINTGVACFIVFIASIGYLWKQASWCDELAASAAKTAVQLCAVVLITGMCWGRGAWGVWWTWSPRLTFSLALFLLFVVYLVIRSSIESRRQRALIAAVYAIIAFLDVPLVYLSARLMPDIHPGSIELEPKMKLTLGLCFIPVTLLAMGLTFGRFLLAAQSSEETIETPSVPTARLGIRGGVL